MKYKFTGKTINNYGKTLKQIIRISDDLIGGYIESENNLSHEGECWVSDNAWVSGNAHVFGNAGIFGNAEVSGDAIVSGNAHVFGYAIVSGYAWVSGNAHVFGCACVSENARVDRDAKVYENAKVYGDAKVSGNDRVYGDAKVYGDAIVSGNAWVYGYADISGNARVYGDSKVYGNSRVSGNDRVYGNATVSGSLMLDKEEPLCIYAKAQQELYNRDTYSTKDGFIIYRLMDDNSLYLHLIYVKQESRRKGIGTNLVNGLLTELGEKVKTAFSYVDLTTQNPEQSIQAHIAYGFKIYKTTTTQVQFVYDLKTTKRESA